MSQSSPYSMEALFRGLRSLLNSLPTEEEKSELLRNLNEAESFLEELRSLVETIPTMESSRELSEGLSRLDILTERANRDAGLRKILGLRGPKSGRNGKTAGPADANGRVSELQEIIAHSDPSQVQDLLGRESLAVLKGVASHLGIRALSKERKLDVVKRIANHIENQRGYALLRGGDPQSP